MTVQLVAVQMKVDINAYWTQSGFEASIRRLMEQVQTRIDPEFPTLVAFPEDVGLMLVALGMEKRLRHATTMTQAIGRAIQGKLLPLAWARWKFDVPWVPALLLQQQRRIAQTYFEVFSQVARDFGVYIVAGSVVLPPYAMTQGQVLWENGPISHHLYNTSYFFGPDGRVIGKQDKVFLIDLEQEDALHLHCGDSASLRVFATPIGNVGIAICLDAFQKDVVDRLTAQGAQILVQPSANPGPWTPEQQEEWLQSSYEATFERGQFAYAVNPMLVGPLWDVHFYGQSAIIAQDPKHVGNPTNEALRLGYMDLKPAEGFIQVASSDREEQILVATVPLATAAHPEA